MKIIKKSLNINTDLAQRIDDFIQNNPGVSFTLIANQALANWLDGEKQVLKLNRPANITKEDIDELFSKRKNVMKELAK